MLTWKELAVRNGWVAKPYDPENTLSGPILHHAELNRVWPHDDWKGAALDIGLTDEDRK